MNRLSYERRVVGMNEAPHIFGRAHGVATDRFSGRVQDRIELIAERKRVGLNVVLPMAGARDFECVQQVRLARIERRPRVFTILVLATNHGDTPLCRLNDTFRFVWLRSSNSAGENNLA